MGRLAPSFSFSGPFRIFDCRCQQHRKKSISLFEVSLPLFSTTSNSSRGAHSTLDPPAPTRTTNFYICPRCPAFPALSHSRLQSWSSWFLSLSKRRLPLPSHHWSILINQGLEVSINCSTPPPFFLSRIGIDGAFSRRKPLLAHCGRDGGSPLLLCIELPRLRYSNQAGCSFPHYDHPRTHGSSPRNHHFCVL